MTEEEARALAREVIAGKARSYVDAAKVLSEFLLASPNVKWSVVKGITKESTATIEVDGELLHSCEWHEAKRKACGCPGETCIPECVRAREVLT